MHIHAFIFKKYESLVLMSYDKWNCFVTIKKNTENVRGLSILNHYTEIRIIRNVKTIFRYSAVLIFNTRNCFEMVWEIKIVISNKYVFNYIDYWQWFRNWLVTEFKRRLCNQTIIFLYRINRILKYFKFIFSKINSMNYMSIGWNNQYTSTHNVAYTCTTNCLELVPYLYIIWTFYFPLYSSPIFSI